MSESSPCLSCGACCSAFRVSFYWAESSAAEGGCVPVELTNSVNPLTRCMQGTDSSQPRCIALAGRSGPATSSAGARASSMAWRPYRSASISRLREALFGRQ